MELGRLLNLVHVTRALQELMLQQLYRQQHNVLCVLQDHLATVEITMSRVQVVIIVLQVKVCVHLVVQVLLSPA